MLGLGVQPRIIGRERELKELRKYLLEAREGRGRTIFIPGETGIGKTRLVTELKQIAKEKGFTVLSGNSTSGSFVPFMPFIEAMKSVGLEHLFTGEEPRVESVYLMTHGGMLVSEEIRHQSDLNPDIFAAMLTEIRNFVSESLSGLSGDEKHGSLNFLGHENFRILIQTGGVANLAVILTGKENELLLCDMKEILQKVEERYGDVLKQWEGEYESTSGCKELLVPLVLSGKYDGICLEKEDPQAKRNLLFENVCMGLVRLARKNPTLLCLEDLHWADPSTLALVHHIARNSKESGLLLLGTYCPEELAIEDANDHPLAKIMQLMSREDLYNNVHLTRLPRESIDEFLKMLLGKNDFSEEFVDRISKETEGNPQFVIRLVKYLIDDDILVTESGIWKQPDNLKDINIPSKIYDVFQRRLDRVENDYREILELASVIGVTFSSSILAYALKQERVRVLEQLRRIELKHMLVHPINGNFRFDHIKVKEALYNEIPKEQKVEYHLCVAQAIEESNKDYLQDVAEELAYHYRCCGDGKKTQYYLNWSAEQTKKKE